MTTSLQVPFHGSNLFVVDHKNQPYTPMKPIVEGMGLAWQSQLAKFSANPERWGITKIVIPSVDKNNEMACLPLRKLFGWLQTISPNKVKTSIRSKVIQYQNECDDVLWKYWTESTAPQAITKNSKQLALPTHKPSHKITLSQLIFELANLRGISPQQVRIHYSQVFNGPTWETDEFALALACVKLRNDIAEEMKRAQPEIKHLNEQAAEQGMKLVSESEFNFMKHRMAKQQMAIEELHKAVITLSNQSQQLISDSFWVEV